MMAFIQKLSINACVGYLYFIRKKNCFEYQYMAILADIELIKN